MSQMNEGIIAWFARNPVAANLLMAVIMAAGLFTAFTIKKEVFPEFSIEQVNINVAYRGGSPQEVEEGVLVRIEEAIQAGVQGDYAPFHRLNTVLKTPFTDQPEHADLQTPATAENAVRQTFCGT